jgi:hypothetical protein
LYSKPRNCSPSPCLPKDVDEFVAMICSFFWFFGFLIFWPLK